jgi:DDE domain
VRFAAVIDSAVSSVSTAELHERISAPHAIPARSTFAGFRFPPDVIVLAVRWYLRFGLSYRDFEELLTERGVEADHVTIYRWVQQFTPLLANAARPCRHAVGDRWQVDETYVKVAGQWRYVYRAIDQFGQVVDVFVGTRRDAKAAHRSSSGRWARPRSRPLRSPPTRRRYTRRCWRSCCQRRGTAPSSTPTTGPRPTTGG